MVRSYLSKLSSVGSAESRTLAPEATTERVEVCSSTPYYSLNITPDFLVLNAMLTGSITF